jgi:GAF domain-containing protein
MTDNNLQAAVSAGVMSAEDEHRALLQSIVEVARSIFSAKASSIFLHDEEADELVFEAVAGEGSENLIGERFPSSTGVAGWVLVTRQPLVIEDLASDPRFARETAEVTGYVPRAMMSVPLLHEERALGVLNVLDRSQDVQFSLGHMELLGLFANQAAIALDLLQRARHARSVLAGSGGDAAVIARIASALEGLDEEQREPVLRLLAALDDVLHADMSFRKRQAGRCPA